MCKYFLAIDIGASSGRHMLGHLENGRLQLEEIHRFKNSMIRKNGHLCWDTGELYRQILTGIAKCGELHKIPQSLGIDTWGVDFVLLDSNGATIGDSVAYRDNRTDGMIEAFEQAMNEQELYRHTGIQKQPFNTIYQLLAIKKQQPSLLEQARRLLLMPEYFHYLLTGRQMHEYTNATTTGLIDVQNKIWDDAVIQAAGLPRQLFGDIQTPGTSVGNLLPDIQEKVGFDCEVVLPCTHDTASAVLSAPMDESCLYLSSGTWSLMGAELYAPICTEESNRLNLTNEGGYQYRYRYLKNIMGLWIIQNIKEECQGKYSFDDLSDQAKQAQAFPSRIDVNQQRFLAPESMMGEIKAACRDAGLPQPDTVGQLMCCVYQSLVDSYTQTVQELEALTGKVYDKICVVGGGSQDTYLNELLAAASGKIVTAGPVEGTAIGNLIAQMLRAGELSSVEQARQVVRESFSITEYGRMTANGSLL